METMLTIPDNRRDLAARVQRFAWIGLVLTGALLRIAFYSLDRHLWLDEAAVALNILDRPVDTLLLSPLDRNQHAPPLFLLIEKLACQSIPHRPIEKVLRLQPLIVSLAGLLLFARLAGRQLAPLPAFIACGLFAISPPLIRYAAEVKPYAGDVFACLILLTLGVSLNQRSHWSWQRLAFFAATGAVLVWYSFPAVFVMAVVGTYLVLARLRARKKREALWMAVASGIWCFSFCLYVGLIGRHSLGNRELDQFWSIGFISFPVRSIGDVRDAFRILVGLIQSPLGFGGWEVPVLLLAVGYNSLRIRNPLIFCVMSGLILILATASAAHLYPISTRLVLFIAPLTIFAIASGAERILVMCRAHWLPTAAFIGVLVSAQLQTVSSEFMKPRQTGFPQVLQLISERTQEGDSIYLYHRVGTTYELYRRMLELPERRTVDGADHRHTWTEYRSDVEKLHGRVWFVFADWRTSPVDEKVIILLHARAEGQMLEQLDIGGTSAALVELRKRPYVARTSR
jgi:hypothetical protein